MVPEVERGIHRHRVRLETAAARELQGRLDLPNEAKLVLVPGDVEREVGRRDEREILARLPKSLRRGDFFEPDLLHTVPSGADLPQVQRQHEPLNISRHSIAHGLGMYSSSNSRMA